MKLSDITDKLPEYAKDLKLNLSTALRGTELTEQQLWGTLLCAAHCTKDPRLIEAAQNECEEHLSVEAKDAARGAAAIMGMNNVFYRFTHFCSNEKYRKSPARLRMNIMQKHGVEASDFELWSLAASAINGCGMCVDSHERSVREHGLGDEQVMAAIRLASTVNGLAVAISDPAVELG